MQIVGCSTQKKIMVVDIEVIFKTDVDSGRNAFRK
jgi:hypothetical protein